MNKIILLLIISTSVFCIPLEDKIFADVYSSDKIGKRHCGLNSELLVKEWKLAGVDISKTEIWHVQNTGFQYLGLVKYYQNRFSNFKNYPYDQDLNYSANYSGGWHFHAFVVHKGKVYDSSYKREPTVVKLKDYILDMFNLKTTIGDKSYLRKDYGLLAMKGYSVESYPAKKYIELKESKQSTGDIVVKCGKITGFLKSKKSCI